MVRNILLVEPKSPDFNIFTLYKIPRLGIVMLGTLAKNAGYNVKLVYCEATALNREHIEWADVVGFSLTTSTAPEGYRLAKMVRALNAGQGVYRPVVFGGVHATFRPEEALSEGDYVFRGEADETFIPFLDALNGKASVEELAGLTYRSDHGIVHNPIAEKKPDMDKVPSPNWSLFESYKLTIGVSMTSRGCPYDCSFCSVTPMFGKRYRMRSIDKIMEDLGKSEKHFIFFYDDHFTADRKRAKALLRRIIEEYGTTHHVKHFSAQVRSDIAKDSELLDLMRRAGFTTLFIGFESINPETLELYNKKQNVEDIMKSIDEIHKRKMKIHGMFVFGSDADTNETFRQTVAFAKKVRLETVQFLILTPLPGSHQYHTFEAENRILSDDWSKYDAFNAVYLPKKITPYELQNGMLSAMKKFYSSGNIFSWIVRGRFTVAAIQLYGYITLRLWIANNKKLLKRLRNDSREIFLPEFMKTSCPRNLSTRGVSNGLHSPGQA